MMWQDLRITSGAVPLAVRDFGGDGPPVLLLHGAGSNLASMTGLARELRPTYRPVAVDLRGHGRSGDGPWRWHEVQDDLAAVTEHLRLANPAVVGLSLGGMVATRWAASHPECPGAVNLDGNPTPDRPEQLPGLEPAQAQAELDRLHETFDAMAAAQAAPLTAAQVEAMVSGHREMIARYGAEEADWLEVIERLLVTAGEATTLRPPPETVAELQVALRELDLLPAYRSARCPLLVVLATEDLPQQVAFHDLYAAYRRYLADQLVEVSMENSNLRVVPLPGASHAMLIEQPTAVAKLVLDFLRQPADPAQAT